MNQTVIESTDTADQRRPIRRIALIAVVALGLAAVAFVWSTRSSSGEHRLIYSETLPDGRVFQCFSDGAFIGSAGSEVSGGQAPQAPEGSEGGPALVVRPPDYTDEEARKAAEEYRKSGRRLEQDQADFDRLSAECAGGGELRRSPADQVSLAAPNARTAVESTVPILAITSVLV